MSDDVILKVKIESEDQAEATFGKSFDDKKYQMDKGAMQTLFSAHGSSPPYTYGEVAKSPHAQTTPTSFVSQAQHPYSLPSSGPLPPPLPPPIHKSDEERAAEQKAKRRQQLQEQGYGSEFEATVGQYGHNFIASSASALGTQLTGSPTIGALVGTAAPDMLAAIGPAAGPAALAAAAVLIKSEMDKKLEESIGNLGQGAASLIAPGDPMSPVLSGANKASFALDPLEGMLGISTNPLDNVVRGLIETFSALDSAALSLADTLKAYSPELATADAERQIRQIQRDYRAGQALGSDLAQYMESREDLADIMNEVRIMLGKNLIPIATFFLQNGVELSRGIAFLAEFQLNGWDELIKLVEYIARVSSLYKDQREGVMKGAADGGLKAAFGPAGGQFIFDVLSLYEQKGRAEKGPSKGEIEKQLESFFDSEETLQTIIDKFSTLP
jgi:hypothetical protein